MSSPTDYRLDIDGLRALAVIAVIFFHFKVYGFFGGYIGVDVFFVISGYLIIRIITKAVEANTFSLIDFWERRMRRILPAMVVVLLATAAAAYHYLLVPADYVDFGITTMLQGLFVSNWWFMGASDYFSAPAETMPLLHTWTLAVEEQFYILLPLFTLVVYPFVKRKFGVVLIALTAASFAYSVFLTNYAPTQPFSIPFIPNVWGEATNASAGFYFIFSRFWEFLVGGLIAIYSLNIQKRTHAEVVSVAGLAALLFGIFTFSDDTQFPGVAALVPVLGTAAIIIANTNHSTKVSKLLSFKSVVWFGLISYSLYLWHWPILVLARYQGDMLSTGTLVFLLALVVLLSWLTYKFVEQPFRQKKYFAEQSTLYIASFVSVAVVIAVGYNIVKNSGFSERLSAEGQLIAAAIDDDNPRKEECFTRSRLAISSTEREQCLLGEQKPDEVDFILWGDSHADAAMPAFDTFSKETNQTGLFFGTPGCAPLFATSTAITDDPSCLEELEKVIEYNTNHPSTTIYIVSEWTAEYKTVSGRPNIQLSSLLANTLETLSSSTPITVLRRIPIFPDENFRTLLLQVERGDLVLQLRLPRANYDKYVHGPIDAHIDVALTNFPHINTIDPTETLCDEKYCYIGKKDGLYYRDSSHLSTAGVQKTILPLLLSATNNTSTSAQ